MADDAPRKVSTHLIVLDQNGPIASGDKRYRVACTPESKLPESASSVAFRSVVTCPLCLDTEEFALLEEEMDGGSAADRAAAKAIKAKAAAKAAAASPALAPVESDALSST
jgi:hypothetical protein